MFWSSELFWKLIFWTWLSWWVYWSWIDFWYNWYSFNSDNFRLRNIPNIDDASSIMLDQYNIALSHWWWFNGYYMKPKKLMIQWTLLAQSASELEAVIDWLKYAVLQKQKELVYTKRDWMRLTTTATCTNMSFERQAHNITFLPVNIEFTILEPFFYSTTVNELTDYWNTGAITWTVSVVTWQYEIEPQIYITYNSATTVTSLTFDLNWSEITINKTITTGDLIIIDCKEKDVLINSVWWQDYNWQFPTLPLWDTTYTLTSNWTYNIDLLIQWKNAYV